MPPATRLGRLLTRQFGEFEAGSARSVEGPSRYPEAGVERHRASPQIGSARARLVAPSPQPGGRGQDALPPQQAKNACWGPRPRDSRRDPSTPLRAGCRRYSRFSAVCSIVQQVRRAKEPQAPQGRQQPCCGGKPADRSACRWAASRSCTHTRLRALQRLKFA
jgi:hypothetical protein